MTSDNDRQFVDQAMQLILERVRRIETRTQDPGGYEYFEFVNTLGDDVALWYSSDEDEPQFGMEVRTADFDSAAPYDPEHCYQYCRRFDVDPETGEVWQALSRLVVRHPAGWTPNIEGGESLGELNEAQFWTCPPAHRLWGMRHSVGVPNRPAPAARTPAIWAALTPESRVAYLLTDPPGLNVRGVPVEQSPLGFATDLVDLSVPDPSKKFGTEWNADARIHSRWAEYFETFAENEAMRRGIDLKQSREFILGASEIALALPDLPRSLRADAETVYLLQRPDRSPNDSEEAAVNWQRAAIEIDEQTKRISANDLGLVEAELLHFRFTNPLATPDPMRVAATVSSSQSGEPATVLVAIGDLTLRRTPAGQYFVTVAAQLDGRAQMQSFGPPVNDTFEIGELLHHLKQWQAGGPPLENAPFTQAQLPPDVDFEFAAARVVAAAQSNRSLTVKVESGLSANRSSTVQFGL